jgi:hypothetical protein
VGTIVASGAGQDDSLVPHSAGNLQASVLATLVESPLCIGGRTEKDTHVCTPKKFAPYSSAANPASFPFPKYEDGVVQVDWPGSENQAPSSTDVGENKESFGLKPS